MIHDSLCDMSSTLIFSNSVCCCEQIAKARAEGYANGYKDAMQVMAEQSGMRLSRKARDTQRKAVSKTLPRSGTKNRLLWDMFCTHADTGLTDDEIEVKTGWTHQSASAHRNLLMTRGLLTDSGQRRKNRRGLDCIVWTPLSPASKEPDDRPHADSDHVRPRPDNPGCPNCGQAHYIDDCRAS